MTDSILAFFKDYSEWAIGISLLFNIIIAVLGVVPSVFLTAANILFFGFWSGTSVSFIGEALGAVVSFALYRKGFQHVSRQKLMRYPRVVHLLDASGKEAFTLIFSLRLLPFVPSGLVTFAGAIGSVSIGIFAAASSLGKIPALLLEAFAVYNITEWNREGKVILGVIALVGIYGIFKKKSS